MTQDYRVHRRPPAWTTFVHFDATTRFSADHEPPCPPVSWQPGDIIADRFEVTAGRTPGRRGVDRLLRRRRLSERAVTSGEHAGADRVAVGTVEVE